MRSCNGKPARNRVGLLLLPAITLGAGCCPPPPPLMRVLMVTDAPPAAGPSRRNELADRLNQRGYVQVEVVDGLSGLSAHLKTLATDRRDADPTRVSGRAPRAGGSSARRVLLLTGEGGTTLDEPARAAILAHVLDGGGLVAIGRALRPDRAWPELIGLLGGAAADEAEEGRFEATVLDPDHPAVLGIGGRFALVDRPLVVNQLPPSAVVLMRMGDPLAGLPDKDPRPTPLVWVRSVGDGRVMALAFGAGQLARPDEWFLTLLHTALRWAGRDLPEPPHNALSPSERQEGYESLFNGRDLTGWAGDTERWSVEDGELVGRGRDLPHNTFIHYTPREYGDFVLKCSVRIRNGNSGVQFRGRVFPGHVVKGYQADVDPRRYGNIYEEGGRRGRLVDNSRDPAWISPAVPDGWNALCIEARGPRIRVTINGVTTADYHETRPELQPASGVIALQLHKGDPMEVRFRDIRVKPLDAATRPAASGVSRPADS
ncbi:MAG: DUF1080 domain-containing protein [Phycisphaerae bacterium]